MNSDSNKLVTLTYSPLDGASGPLTVANFDTNTINIYKDLESLAVTSNVPNYNAGTTYNNDYTDSTTEHFAMHSGRLWMWVNATPNSGVTPVSGASWQEVFPVILAHEKNKDAKLQTLDGFTVSVDDDVYPRAEVEYISAPWKYAAGVQLAGVTAQASIGCRNTTTNETLNLTINNVSSSIRHSNTSSVTTAAISVESGKVRIQTTAQIAGTITVGDKVTAVNVDGSLEFEKGAWTTATRPSSPYNGRDGFNSTLSQREYWNGSTWIQY